MKNYYDTNNEEVLVDIFKIFDRDGNGYINTNEVRVLMEAVSCGMVDENAVQTLMADADTNRDGVIDMKEFIAVMKKDKS